MPNGHKSTTYIDIVPVLKEATGQNNLIRLQQDVKNLSAQVQKEFDKIGLHIDKTGSLTKFAQQLGDANISIQKFGDKLVFSAQSADGLSHSFSTLLDEQRNWISTESSWGAQRLTPVQELEAKYKDLFVAEKRVFEYEKIGDTQSVGYQEAVASVEALTKSLKDYEAELQKRYNLQLENNDALNQEVFAGEGAIAKTQRRMLYTQQANAADRERILNLQALRNQEKQEQSMVNQYIASLREQYVAEEQLRKMQENGSNPEALLLQRQYIDALVQHNAQLLQGVQGTKAFTEATSQLDLMQKKHEATLANVNAKAKQSQGIFTNIKESFLRIGKSALISNISFMALMKVVNAVSQASDKVIEFNTALTNLQIASGKTKEEVQDLIVEYNKLAKAVGATTSEVTEAAVEWQRQGYTVEETSTLIYDAMVLSKVGLIESSEATEYLTSAMKGYKVAAEDALSIVDKLSAVDLKAAVSSGDLAEGMSKTAASANMAGVSMDELLGYLATVGEVTQKSMSSVGESFKTMFARFGQIKAGKFVDEETGEDLNDIAKVLNKFGIELYNSAGEMRDISEVFDKLNSQWTKYNDVQKNALATAIAGTRQRENFIVLMENYSKAMDLVTASETSAGTAQEKFDVWLQSIQAKIESLKATLEGFVQGEGFQTFASGVVDITKTLAEVIQFMGGLNPLLVSFGSILSLKVVTGLKDVSLRTKQQIYNSAQLKVSTQQLTTQQLKQNTTIMALSGQLKTLGVNFTDMSGRQVLATLNTSGFSKALLKLEAQERKNILTAIGLSTEQVDYVAKSLGATAATNNQTQSMAAQATISDVLKAKLAELKIVMQGMSMGSWITIILTAATTIYSMISSASAKAEQAIQEAEQAYEDAKSKLKSAESALKENLDAIEDLENRTESLNFEEKTRLATLKSQTAELRIQAQLAADRASSEQKEQAKKHYKEYSDSDSWFDLGGAMSDTFGGNLKTTPYMVKKAAKGGYSQYSDASKAQLYANIVANGQAWVEAGKITAEELEKAKNQLKSSVAAYIDAQLQLIEDMDSLSEVQKAEIYGADWENVLKQAKQNFDDAYKAYYGEDAWKEYKFESLINTSEFQSVGEELKTLGEQGGLSIDLIVSKYPELIAAMKEFYAEGTEDSKIAQDIINQYNKASSETSAFAESVEDLNSSLDKLTGVYDSLSGAVEEYNKNGYLTVDTFKDLIENYSDYLPLLKDENGQLTLNSETLKKNIALQIERAAATSSYEWVLELSKKSEEELTEAINGEITSVEDDIVAKYKLIHATIEAMEISKKEKQLIWEQVLQRKKLADSTIKGIGAEEDSASTTENVATAISYATTIIDKKIDALKEEKEAQKKANEALQEELDMYDKALSYMNKYINGKIKALEDEKEALEDKNDETERAIKLQELQNNLAKANQKTMRVYYENQGWVWETDPEAINEAQDALRDYQKEIASSDIDAQIDKWKEFQDTIGDVASAYDEAEEEKAFAKLAGVVNEEDLDKRNLNAIDNFKSLYFYKEKQITEFTTDNIDEQIDSFEKLKEQYENISSNYENSQNALLVEQLYGANIEEAILSGRMDIIQQFTDDYTIEMDNQATAAESAASRISEAYSSIEGLDFGDFSDYDGTSGTTTATGGATTASTWYTTQQTKKFLDSASNTFSANLLNPAWGTTHNMKELLSYASYLKSSSSSSSITIGNITLPSVTDSNSFITQLGNLSKNR